MFETLLRKQSTIALKHFFHTALKLSCSDSALVKDLKIKAMVESDFTRIQKKEFTGLFVEKLFINRFQETVLEYPEIDCIAEVKALEEHVNLAQNAITEDGDPLLEADNKKAVSVLKKHELSGFKVPRARNGFGYLQSEYTFMQEALAVDPSLSKTVCEHENFGIYLLDQFGSELQKDRYLAQLINGQKLASFADIEEETLVSLLPLTSTNAKLSPDGQSYIISGKKCWVYNANSADLFILSASVSSNEGEKSESTLFLVDRNTPGVEVHKPVQKIGLKTLSICDVTFNNVVVPVSSVLGKVCGGDKIIKQVLSKGKLSTGGHCIGAMRQFIDRAIQHCIHNEFFKKDKTDSEYFKIKVGNMCSRLYVVESMTYLMTGRLDEHKDIDAFLESLIIKIHASETLQFIIKETMDILGPEFFSSDNEVLVELAKDSQFYIACDDANDYLRLILSGAGLEYARKYKEKRGVWQMLVDVIHNMKTEPFIDKPSKLSSKGILQGYLHPMFQEESLLLEDAVMILTRSSKYLMTSYKDKLFDRHSQLRIIADMVIGVYAMAATLARASRAYCLGVKFQEYDRFCTEAEIRRFYLRIDEWKFLVKRPEELFSKHSAIAGQVINGNAYSDLLPILKSLTVRKGRKT